MGGRTFVDAGVLVYLFDADAEDKQAAVRRLLAADATAGRWVVGTQVLADFYVAVTRELAKPLSEDDAHEATRALAELGVVQVDADAIDAAIALSRREGLPFHAALAVRAAVAAGCDRLLSEELPHGREFEGVRVENPFRELP